MDGRTVFDLLVILTSIWWLIASWRLWRDPSRLDPKHWQYAGIYRRVRGLLRKDKDAELTSKEIRDYAASSMVGALLGIALGIYLLMTSLT
jgi:hypothetical protein